MCVSLCVGVGTNTRIRTILQTGLGQILTVRLKHWWARVVMRIGLGDLVVVFKITTPHIVPSWWAFFTMPLSTGTVGTWIWGKHKSVFQGQHQNGFRTNYLLCLTRRKTLVSWASRKLPPILLWLPLWRTHQCVLNLPWFMAFFFIL